MLGPWDEALEEETSMEVCQQGCLGRFLERKTDQRAKPLCFPSVPFSLECEWKAGSPAAHRDHRCPEEWMLAWGCWRWNALRPQHQ